MSNLQSARLTRAESSIYLREKHGIRRTAGTLAKLACLGGGPAFRKAGTKTVLYEPHELDRWAESILSKPVISTSCTSA